MRRKLWRYVYGTAIMLMIPSLLGVSWINIYLGNLQYDFYSYLRAYIVPAVMLSFVLAFLTYLFLAKFVHITVGKVFFTLFGLLTIFVVIRYGTQFFGLNPIFLTLEITKQDNASLMTANQYYSFSLPFSLTVTFILYQLGGLLTKSK